MKIGKTGIFKILIVCVVVMGGGLLLYRAAHQIVRSYYFSKDQERIVEVLKNNDKFSKLKVYQGSKLSNTVSGRVRSTNDLVLLRDEIKKKRDWNYAIRFQIEIENESVQNNLEVPK